MFQSLLFWFSYLLRVVGDATDDDDAPAADVIIRLLVCKGGQLMDMVMLVVFVFVESTSWVKSMGEEMRNRFS